MKKLFVIVNAAIFFISCNNSATTAAGHSDSANTKVDSQPADKTAVTTTDTGNLKINAVATEGSSNDFANKAAEGGLMEVAMGKLAQSNASRADIKEYGKMLEKDHSEANNKLKAIASAEKISLPNDMSSEQNKELDHMQTLKAGDFDKEYISMMIEDHTKDIAEFKEAAKGNENKKIKDFASATLPTLQTHLDKAKAIRQKMEQ